MNKIKIWIVSFAVMATSSPAFSQGLSSSGGLSAGGGGLNVGVSAIAGTCTNGYLLYNNGGILGCQAAGTATLAIGNAITSSTAGQGLYVGTGGSANTLQQFAYGVNVFTALQSALNGTGAISASTSPTFVTPILGTPTSATLTNATGLPISTGVSGLGTGVATALGVNIGSAGAPVLFNGALGTPSSGTLTNATGLPLVGLASQAANTVVGALTATTPSALAVPSCSGASNALIWTSGTGFGCNTISASGLAFPVTVTGGTSGGIPYFSATTTLSSSALLTANALMIGGGAGVAPSTVTTGTGVLTALGVNVGSAGAPVVNGGALGTPSSGTLTNATGLPISTGVSGLGANIATALGSALNGTGAISATTSATFVTPVLGTPTSVTLTNATGLPISTGVSGLGTGAATALGVNVGTAGAFVVNGGALGTPSGGTLTNATGLPISTGVSGLGTGVTTALAFAPNAIGGFLTTPSGVCTSGQYLTFLTASSTPTCGTPAGTGTVTSVATGFGLTGGPITSTGTAAYDPTQIGWSYRNRLVNSGMLIDQVNVGAAYTLAAASGITNYTIDQWYAYESAVGTGLTATQLSVKTGGINYALRVQRANASTNTNTTALLQPIESNNMIDLQGRAVTLSFRARVGANWSGSTPAVAIIAGTTADQGAASLAAGSWAGQTTCGSATPTLTTTFAFYVVTCTVASGALEIAPKFSWAWSGTAGAADNIDITDIELVPGTYTAAQVIPERHQVAYDLAECQRYFTKSYDLATAPGTASSDASSLQAYEGPTADSASYLQLTVPFPLPMKSDPIVTIYNPHVANTTAQAYMANAAASVAAGSTLVSQMQASFYLNGVSVLARDVAEFHYTANARM